MCATLKPKDLCEGLRIDGLNPYVLFIAGREIAAGINCLGAARPTISPVRSTQALDGMLVAAACDALEVGFGVPWVSAERMAGDRIRIQLHLAVGWRVRAGTIAWSRA